MVPLVQRLVVWQAGGVREPALGTLHKIKVLLAQVQKRLPERAGAGRGRLARRRGPRRGGGFQLQDAGCPGVCAGSRVGLECRQGRGIRSRCKPFTDKIGTAGAHLGLFRE